MENRAAVVTGGGGAICGAIAGALSARGVPVAIWDISREAGERRAERIRAAGGRAVAVGCDVLDAPSIREALEQTEAALGPVGKLVNGAGGSRREATTAPELAFFDIVPQNLMHTLELNYLSAVLPSQAAGRRFAEAGSGAILNISSVAGLRPLSRSVAYCNGKAALVSFTQWLAVHMAREYSPSIRVNALAPGFVLTEQNRFLLVDETTGEPTERGRRVMSAVPMGRYGTPEEMVGAALWLLSEEEASFVTGAVVPVDGGFSAESGV